MATFVSGGRAGGVPVPSSVPTVAVIVGTLGFGGPGPGRAGCRGRGYGQSRPQRAPSCGPHEPTSLTSAP
ncbi:hypothetical protein [Krasilnikovia cinnamomea]|uniref:hypothetical protein n=1 Tax=Krasilnikovia cinnamomea TaxID=349313 RepID=UPI00102CD1F4|nr:hypothetical protein [Krasilnikovia cinnamomea]